MNVFYLTLAHTSAVTVNDLKDVADFIAARWAADHANALTSNVILTQVDVSFIPSAGNVLDYTGSYSNAAGNGDVINDAAACVVVDWTISDRYRGGHPRSYLPGPRSTKVTNGSTLDATWRSDVATFMNDFRNTINAHTTTNITAITMGTVRFESAHNWMSPPVFRAYTSVKVRARLGTQRRRINS